MFRVNGQIRAREVRVIGPEGKQIGILPLAQAINLARQHGLDLVEVAPNANPPVCKIVDYGKFRYEQSKKERESKKHQQSSKLKEIQLRPTIDQHDFEIKLARAIGFLCDDMKVKIVLRFRGREMAHQEIGREVVERFLKELTPYGKAAESPRQSGRTIQVVVNPLPKQKRAPNPFESKEIPEEEEELEEETEQGSDSSSEFGNRPFEGLAQSEG